MAGAWEAFEPKDYIDKRKSMSIMFNFCPNCGKKINWRKLRKNLLEGE